MADFRSDPLVVGLLSSINHLQLMLFGMQVVLFDSFTRMTPHFQVCLVLFLICPVALSIQPGPLNSKVYPNLTNRTAVAVDIQYGAAPPIPMEGRICPGCPIQQISLVSRRGGASSVVFMIFFSSKRNGLDPERGILVGIRKQRRFLVVNRAEE
eukprot:g30811.t1